MDVISIIIKQLWPKVFDNTRDFRLCQMRSFALLEIPWAFLYFEPYRLSSTFFQVLNSLRGLGLIQNRHHFTPKVPLGLPMFIFLEFAPYGVVEHFFQRCLMTINQLVSWLKVALVDWMWFQSIGCYQTPLPKVLDKQRNLIFILNWYYWTLDVHLSLSIVIFPYFDTYMVIKNFSYQKCLMIIEVSYLCKMNIIALLGIPDLVHMYYYFRFWVFYDHQIFFSKSSWQL